MNSVFCQTVLPFVNDIHIINRIIALKIAILFIALFVNYVHFAACCYRKIINSKMLVMQPDLKQRYDYHLVVDSLPEKHILRCLIAFFLHQFSKAYNNLLIKH